MPVDLLILGAGWTSSFLISACKARSVSYATTTRSGRDSSIPFIFDPITDDTAPYDPLPDAKTVLITFPINQPGAATRLVRLYNSSRKVRLRTGFIQLGTTGNWDSARKKPGAETGPKPAPHSWYDRHSPIILPTPRASAEAEFLGLNPGTPTTVLNLAGLWGGTRDPRRWVARVAPTKDALQSKGSLHVVHGADVARAVLSVHADFVRAAGERWVVTDGRVYDWWDLAAAWGTGGSAEEGEDWGPQARWVRELMEEEGVRALPRNVEALGRALDSREFWTVFRLTPERARLESGSL